MGPQLIKEVIDCPSDGVPKVEFLAVGDLSPVLNHLVKFTVYSLDEILGGSFEQQDLVVVVSMVAKVAALLTY